MKCRLYGAGREAGSGPDSAAGRQWNRWDRIFFLTAGGSSLLFALADIPALIGMAVL
jgi:hypothetical protein